MPKPPILKPREVITILESLGFQAVCQRGSYIQFRHVA
ncbi:MAG: type II toxin-antitoxin system HicA family toxin [Phycisphaerae bacterium]